MEIKDAEINLSSTSRFKNAADLEKQLNIYFERKVDIAVVKSTHLHVLWAKDNRLHRMRIPLPGGVFYCTGMETFIKIAAQIKSTL